MDHIAGQVQLETKGGKNPAEIGMIISVNDHAVAVFSFHILNKLLCKPNLVPPKRIRKKILSFHIKMIVHRCCLSIVPAVSGKSQLLYWSHRKLPQRIFPGTVIKKALPFLP